MNLRRIAELAALVTAQAGHIIRSEEPFSDEFLGDYLECARDRDRLWRTGLEIALATDGENSKRHEQIILILEETLVSEVLSRVWTAIMCSAKSRSCFASAEPIARHVHCAMLESRYRSLKAVVDDTALPLGQLTRANRLRRKCERWTDLLIGHLATRFDVIEFAADERRSKDFSDDFRAGSPTDYQALWALATTSLSRTFPDRDVATTREGVHSRMLSSILKTIPSSAFDSRGRFKSPLRRRLDTLVSQDSGHPSPQ